MNYTRKFAFKYHRFGLSVIPISIRGDKRPYGSLLPSDNGKASWSPFKTRLATKAELDEMFLTTYPSA